MKNSFLTIKNKIISSYSLEEEKTDHVKTADINVLLNRVKLDQKRESRKKLLFSATASAFLLLFGVLIF